MTNRTLTALALLAFAGAADAAGHGMAPMVEAMDQDVSNGVVSATKIVAPENGWLVVHRTDGEMKPGAVRLMGFVDDLPTVLGCLDLVVHPADMEGLGVALLQAAAARLPIIASRAGGMPEAVVHGESGLLIEPGDVPALAAALLRLLDDPKERARMGEAGRARVLADFSVDAMCAGNLAVYERVLGR